MPSAPLRLTRLIGLLALLCIPINGLCTENSVVFGPRDFTVGFWGVHVSAHRFACDASSEGTLVVSRPASGQRFWGGFVLVNESFFSLYEFLEGSQPVFEAGVNLHKTNVIGVTLIGQPGAAVSIEVRAGSSVMPPQVTFSATPESITPGQTSTLQWTTSEAQSITIEPGLGAVAPSGSQTVSPQATTTYTLTAVGPGGSATRAATVTVIAPPPTVSLLVSPAAISAGEIVILTWNSTNTQNAAIEPGIGPVPVSGTVSTSPSATTTFIITATGAGGTAQASATVTVYRPPSVSLSASAAVIPLGGSATLSWSAADAQAAHIDQGIGSVPLQGSRTVSPTVTTTYTLTATGTGGTAHATVTVAVTGNPAPQPEGSFGQKYQDLIPPDATVERYDPKRFALVTGLVQDIQGLPLPGVLVGIHGHPGYGTAATDAEGRFSLPVEGGGLLTVSYRKAQYISAQRQVHAPWSDTAVVETVNLTAEDAAATIVKFNGSAAAVVTHRSTEVTDARGTRAATVVFTGDNKAYLTDQAGNKTLELAAITTRATEYRVPESMPAVLPPTSAFTWCAELQVDEAERVKFEKPVTLWVENFLGFPVGAIVPVGYYDRDRAAWAPSENGRVVQLLDTDGDGVVDALDANGDGEPDDLNANGSTKDEVLGLGDKERYAAGATFWRVAVTHFSPYDLNWPLVLPSDSITPNPPGTVFADQQLTPQKDSRTYTCSFVEEKSRVFHEDIPIPGTGLTLHYASNRVQGYKPGVLTIPASGETVPPSLQQIIVQVEVAGKILQKELPPKPNQTAYIEWDGLDHTGRAVDHPVRAHVKIGFVYLSIYAEAATQGPAFGQPGVQPLPVNIWTQRPMIRWLEKELLIVKGKGTIAEGWTLSNHHQISPMEPSVLLKGDGTIAQNTVKVVETIAGTGEEGFSGDGGPATDARLGPQKMTADAAGNVYVTDGARILRIDAAGIIETVIGGRSCKYFNDTPEGKDAREACWNGIDDFVLDPNGNFYVASFDIVARVDPDQIIRVIAGTYGKEFWSGDGGPARQATIRSQYGGIYLDRAGNLFIAQYWNNCVRRIDTSGIITTFAGTGAEGHAGDGGPATRAQLYHPMCVTGDAEGNIYIGEYGRIRKIDLAGIVTTYAGGGTKYPPYDDMPATEVFFSGTSGMQFDSEGNLYTTAGHLLHRIDKTGRIRTVAGSYPIGFGGDGGVAALAKFWEPKGLAIDPSGNIYIADTFNHRIRKINMPTKLYSELAGDKEELFAEESGLGHVLQSSGRHLRTIDLETGTSLVEFGYDANGELSTITDRHGNRTLIERGSSGGVPTAIISPDGTRTALTIDSRNHLTGISYPDGKSYRFEYTAGGLATLKVQPQGNLFSHFYDATGRLSDFLDEEGGHWTFSNSQLPNGEIRYETLTAEGSLTTQVDRNALSGAYQSTLTDAAGAQTVVTESADELTVIRTLSCGMNINELLDLDPQYKYKYVKQSTAQTPSGLKRVTKLEPLYTDANADHIPDLITRKASVNGRTSILTHDIGAARKTLASAEGRMLTAYYDPNSLLTEKLEVPGLLGTFFTYDQRGRLIQTVVGNRVTSFGYTDRGFLGSVTDAQGRTTSYAHDALGRVKQVSRPDQSQIQFDYDANGSMAVLVNPSGVAHRFAYNKVNHPSAYTTPMSGSYLYKYDKDRRLTETVLPSGRSVRNIYDKGRLVGIEAPAGTTYFNYLCGSKLASVTRDGEGITYGYDGRLLTSETLSGSLNQALSYVYDNNFELVQATYAGQSTGYGYDQDGLLAQAGPYSIARDAGNGLPIAVSDGKLVLNRAFNGYGEVASQALAVSGRPVSSWSLLRDSTGRITRRSEAVGGSSAVYDYLYDANGRLLKVLKDNVPVEEYAYDENGARIFEMNTLRGIGSRSYEYSDEDHLLKAGEWVYQYNADGFLTSKTNSTNPTNRTLYYYSSRGELLTVILPDGKHIDYVCDPLGRRIAKKVNGTVVEKYLWQDLTRLLAVYDGNNSLLMRFEYADDRMPAAMRMAGATYYLSYDQAGSLRAVADASGSVVKQIFYDSFGNVSSDTNPGFTVRFGFAGGLHDRDTALVRFGYRDYDPEVGRWTAKDPIGFAAGDTDFYGYVLNNPTNYTDPTGEIFNLGAAAVGVAIGAGVGVVNALFNDEDVLKGAFAGALIGSTAGLSFGASLMTNTLIGAAIGGLTDIVAQKYVNPCGNINGTSVFISALAGAVGGGAGTAMLKGGTAIVDAALFSGAISAGISIGLNYSAIPTRNIVPYGVLR